MGAIYVSPRIVAERPSACVACRCSQGNTLCSFFDQDLHFDWPEEDHLTQWRGQTHVTWCVLSDASTTETEQEYVCQKVTCFCV